MGEPGTVYIQRMKGEYEGVIPQFTEGGNAQATLTATNMRYYTIVGKKNLPPVTSTQDAAGFLTGKTNEVHTAINADTIRTYLLDTLPESIGGKLDVFSTGVVNKIFNSGKSDFPLKQFDRARTFGLDTAPEFVGEKLYQIGGVVSELPSAFASAGRGINKFTLKLASSDFPLKWMDATRTRVLDADVPIAPDYLTSGWKMGQRISDRVGKSDFPLKHFDRARSFVLDEMGNKMGGAVVSWGDTLLTVPGKVDAFTLRAASSDFPLKQFDRARDYGLDTAPEAIGNKLEEWVDYGEYDVSHFSGWVSQVGTNVVKSDFPLKHFDAARTYLLDEAPFGAIEQQKQK
jgi:hypothetical protein